MKVLAKSKKNERWGYGSPLEGLEYILPQISVSKLTELISYHAKHTSMTHPEDKEGSEGERQAKGRKEQDADDKVEPRRLGSTFQNYGRSGKLIEGEYGYGRTWK